MERVSGTTGLRVKVKHFHVRCASYNPVFTHSICSCRRSLHHDSQDHHHEGGTSGGFDGEL